MPRANNNVIRGSRRDDQIEGSAADEVILGRRGDDTIDGGGGVDVVTGGAGADVFVLNPGDAGDQLIITDFENGVDLIDLSAFNMDPQDPNGGAYSGYLADLNGDTIVTFYDNVSGNQVGEIVLQGFSYLDIDMSDYIL